MIYSFLYMLSTAIAGVVIHIVAKDMSEYVVLFWATITGLIVFNLVNYNNLRKTYYGFISKDRRVLFLLNLYVAVSCLSFFFLQSYFDPSLVLLLGFAFLSLIGAYKRLVNDKNKIYYLKLYILILFNVFLIFDYFDPYKSLVSLELFVGVLIYAVSTFLLADQGYIASNDKGYSSKQVLSVRFYIMLIISFLFLCMHIKVENMFNINGMLVGITVGLSAYILPVLFSQKSIEKIGAAKHSVMIGMTPFVICIVEPICTREINFNQHLFLSICLAAIIFIPVFLFYRLKAK